MRSLFVFALFLAFVGCTEEHPILPGGAGDSCSDDAPCRAGLVCKANVCASPASDASNTRSDASSGDAADAAEDSDSGAADGGGADSDSGVGDPDSGEVSDSGVAADSGDVSDSGVVSDGGVAADAGFPDALPADLGPPLDSGPLPDSGVPSCNMMLCNSPPPRVCIDAQRLRHFASVGTCAPQGCEYATADYSCTQGCAGSACAPGSYLSLTIDGDASEDTAITVDPWGQPHIGYIDGIDLKVASLTDRGWIITTADASIGFRGGRTMFMETDAAGGLHIAYTEAAARNVRYAYRAPGATMFNIEFVASIGDLMAMAIALDAQGVPHVLYYDTTTIDVVLARRQSANNWVVTHSGGGNYSSGGFGELELDAGGAPYIAYTSSRLNGSNVVWISELGTPAGNTWTFETLPVKWVTGFVRDPNGTVHVLMTDLNTGITAHHRAPGGAWTQQTVSPLGYDSIQGDLQADPQGNLHAAFMDSVGNVARSSFNGTTWTPAVVVQSTWDYNPRSIQLDFAPNGALHMTAMEEVTDELKHITPFR